jgi:glycosyltransferase involved in cell wall biosynthesis
MAKASIVYWYDGAKIRSDGGGQRIRAWTQALETLGFQCEVIGLWTIGGGVSKGARLSAAKRALLPMPFTRSMPSEAVHADVVIATVPAVFEDALRRVPQDRLILDWMDLWSVNARNLGDAEWFSRPGGRAQSRLWARREPRLVGRAQSNVFAGYADFEHMLEATHGRAAWVPNPVPARASARKAGPIRTIGFIGNLDYPPNQISLRQFLTEYARHLQENQIELLVAGYGSEKVASWGFPISVLGPVESVEGFYGQIDAAVVPIHHGGGIKVKAVEALSFGLPVFGTEHVRSGLSPDMGSLILPLERLKHPLELEVSAVGGQSEFRKRFSQDTFTESVAHELRHLRKI